MPKLLLKYHLDLTEYQRLYDFIKVNILDKQALTSLFKQTTSGFRIFLNKDQKKVRDSDDQRNSILKICIEKYNKNKKQDDDEIFPILLKLADLGTYSEAEYYLSLLYINKQGITKGETVPNLEYAKQFNKWLRQAAGNGHTKAEELLKVLVLDCPAHPFCHVREVFDLDIPYKKVTSYLFKLYGQSDVHYLILFEKLLNDYNKIAGSGLYEVDCGVRGYQSHPSP
ncbi:6559_t:CDS:2 [Gigaspora margarita]|uniref:6559_t:CDS:1 n=1 Tax=Gigaspora margarita TaxID=4874 RepID=A0ABM8VYL1_GIGMA|nr:6559_t:CDS:2 [Gigaspora margarita]